MSPSASQSPPSGVSPASVFRVSLFPATLCFAVFRVSEFGRGCEGPCFVFRVSDFPRLFRACGALGLRRRLRRALTSQGRKPQRQTQTVIKSVRRLYLTSVENVVTASVELASPLPLPLAVPCLHYVSAPATRGGARRSQPRRRQWRRDVPRQRRPCRERRASGHFGDQNSFGRVSCFTFRWVAVFRVSLFGRQPCFVFHFSVFHVFRVSAGRRVKHRWGPSCCVSG